MFPNPSRRDLLRYGSVGIGSAVAGCSELGLGRSGLSLVLLNFTAERQRLYLDLLRADREEYDEAVALNREFDLPAPSGDEAAGKRRVEDAVAVHPYLVRAELLDGVRDHYHFYPDCGGEDGPPSELYVEVHEWQDDDSKDGRYVRFQHNGC